MTDELNDENQKDLSVEEEITFEPETDSDQAMPQKDLAEKVKKLKTELEEVKKEKQEYLDGWMRMKADMANLKSREESERKEFIKFAKEGVVEEMLQVLQSFDMAFANKEAWGKVDANWRAGVEYIYKQFRDVLESHGLSEINPIGQVFNPAEHEAVAHAEVKDEKENNIVIEVAGKGYKFHDKVLKPARVKVGGFKK